MTHEQTILALLGFQYDQIMEQIEEMKAKTEKLVAERDEYKEAYDRQTELALKQAVTFEKMKVYLCKFLDEFEGQFDSDERCHSDDIAYDYIAAATFMKKEFGRDDAKRIQYVQHWVDMAPYEKSYK